MNLIYIWAAVSTLPVLITPFFYRGYSSYTHLMRSKSKLFKILFTLMLCNISIAMVLMVIQHRLLLGMNLSFFIFTVFAYFLFAPLSISVSLSNHKYHDFLSFLYFPSAFIGMYLMSFSITSTGKILSLIVITTNALLTIVLLKKVSLISAEWNYAFWIFIFMLIIYFTQF